MKKYWTKEEEEKLLELYYAGYTAKQIAEILGRTKHSVNRKLDRLVRVIRRTPEEIQQQIVEDYKNGVKLDEIQKKYKGIDIFAILKKYNVYDRQGRVQRKYKSNEHYFDEIDDEHKAYWLGFILADGCIHKNKLTISLAEKDKGILEVLKKDLETDAMIYTTVSRSGFSKHKLVRIDIHSKHLIEQLKNKGIQYRKTYKDNSIVLQNVPIEFFNHFIRGFFDGDGTVMRLQKKFLQFELLGKIDLLEGIKKQIYRILQIEGSIIKAGNHYIGVELFRLIYNRIKDIPVLYDWLYKDATVYLGRKKKIWDEFIEDMKNYKYKWLKWTEKEIEILNEMLKEGKPLREIGERIGRTYHSVYQFIRQNPDKIEVRI